MTSTCEKKGSTKNTIQSLFSVPDSYKVPAYQRAYSWDEEHLSQFINDIEEQPVKKPYYLGHFLFEAVEEGGNSVYVIDGQQRMTTLALFFGCLMRVLSNRHDQQNGQSPINLDAIRECYLERKYEMRFDTVRDDQVLFRDLVLNGSSSSEAKTRSQKRLKKACDYFAKVMENKDTSTLLRWNKTVQEAEVTHFRVHDKVQSTQIFTLQNSRGKELTELEKLKAYLMYQVYLHAPDGLENHAIKRIESHFENIYRESESIKRLDEDAVLRHHDRAYSSHSPDNSPTDNLKKDIDAVTDNVKKVETIESFCKQLATSFSHVIHLEGLISIQELIADPIILDGANSWPFLLKLYAIYGDKIVHEPELKQLLKNVEITLFKFAFLHGRSSNDLVNYTKRLKGEDNVKWLQDEMKRCSQYSFRHRGDFNLTFRAFLDGDYHYTRSFRYLLWKYENFKTFDNDRKVSPGDYLNEFYEAKMETTIEHVAPQAGSYPDEFRNHFINNLGNLVFIPKGLNSTLSDKPPLEKAPILAATTYGSNHEIAEMIAESNKWTEDEIKERKRRIIVFSLMRWAAET